MEGFALVLGSGFPGVGLLGGVGLGDEGGLSVAFVFGKGEPACGKLGFDTFSCIAGKGLPFLLGGVPSPNLPCCFTAWLDLEGVPFCSVGLLSVQFVSSLTAFSSLKLGCRVERLARDGTGGSDDDAGSISSSNSRFNSSDRGQFT